MRFSSSELMLPVSMLRRNALCLVGALLILSLFNNVQAAVSTGFYNVTVTAANGCTTSLTNIVVSGPGGCFICPTIGSIAATNTIICQNTNNTISVSGLADLDITYGIQFKYSMTPLANPYLSTAGTVMSTVTNANLTGSGTGASTTYSFPTSGTVYVYAILSPTSPDPACRPYLVKSFAVAATPALTDPTDQILCTGSTTAAVSLVATPPATTTFAWTNSRTSIGLAASGTGNIAAFTAINFTNAPVTATVVVTPTNTESAGGTTIACVGPTQSYTYTVNPTPTVNAVANQTVCRGSNVAAVTFTGAITGTVYNWTNSNTAIGLAASGTGNIASFVGTNTTAAPISGTITVTPVYTNAGVTCTGTPRTFTITVNPIPTVNPVANFAACHNTTAAAAFSGATTGTVFNWTNSNPAIGLPASGSGNISFTALNTTSAPVTATVTVTLSFANGGTTCVGTPTSFVITVNPLPVVTTGTLPGRICVSDTLVRLNGTPVGGSWSGFGISGFNFMPPATDVGTWPITYTYADANGCVNSASTTVTVLACEERNRDLDNGAVVLYPNPNSGQFNLRVNSTRFNVLGMKVYNTAGQLVYVNQWRGLVFARVIPVNLNNLAAGTYMVRLYYGDGMDRGADKTYPVIIAH